MTDQVVPANIPRDSLREQVQEKYAGLAAEPEATWHFNVGRPLATMLGYTEAQIASVPSEIVETFAGTGNPFSFGALTPGETVLDLGCGAGFDTLLAARQVGPAGRVIAVDMTQAMLDKAQQGAREAGLDNVETRLGFAENLPLESDSVDVVISNGVINLCPDKLAVMQEIFRVLRPGGRVQIADMVVHRAIPQEVKDDIELWSGWIAGALLYAEWKTVLMLAGFTEPNWGPEVDVFAGSRHEADAAEFETMGITFTAAKQARNSSPREAWQPPGLVHKLPLISREVDVQEPVDPAARMLGILADPNRLNIVRVLTEDCQHVSDIVNATGLPQPLVSHHLRVLKDHGLAISERQGAYTTYWLRRDVKRMVIRVAELAQRLAALSAEPPD